MHKEWMQKADQTDDYVIVSEKEIGEKERAIAQQMIAQGAHEDVVVPQSLPPIVFLDHALNTELNRAAINLESLAREGERVRIEFVKRMEQDRRVMEDLSKQPPFGK